MNFTESFPLIYCTNLGYRQDRRVRCEDEFERAGLRVRRFPAVDARYLKTTAGFETPERYAHALTTRLVLRRALLLKAPSVFIFQDNVVLADDLHEGLTEIDLPDDWGMFYLGGQHHERPLAAGVGLVRVTALLDMHAWGVRAHYFRTVLRALRRYERSANEPNPATDVALARLHDEVPTYAAFPNLAWQAEEHWDSLGGSYSTYRADGTQKWAEYVIAGMLAETFAGKASEPARRLAREHTAWFRSRSLSAPAVTLLEEKPGDMTAPAFPTISEATNQSQQGSDSPPASIALAFLFLTRGDLHHPHLWGEYLGNALTKREAAPGSFVQTADAHTIDRCTFVFGHAADVQEVRTSWLLDAQISHRDEAAWARISLVRAQLALLRDAVTEGADFFVFASESCVPIRPLADLLRTLRLDGRSRFHYEEWDTVGSKDSKARRAQALRGIPKSYCVFHSPWVLLNREAAELLIEDDFTSKFEEMFAPDESYFGTALRMKGYPLQEKVVSHSATYTKRPRGSDARLETFTDVSPSSAAELVTSGCFFARKFAPESNIADYGLIGAPRIRPPR